MEPLDVVDFSDDELRQHYSLTFKIKSYYEKCKSEDLASHRMYNSLILQAQSDIETLIKELEKRCLATPSFSHNMEEVHDSDAEDEGSAAQKPTEKNEEGESSDEDDTTQHGEVSYETPIIVRKLEANCDANSQS